MYFLFLFSFRHVIHIVRPAFGSRSSFNIPWLTYFCELVHTTTPNRVNNSWFSLFRLMSRKFFLILVEWQSHLFLYAAETGVLLDRVRD